MGCLATQPETTTAEVVEALRFKVTLTNIKGISRTIEVREDQTLEDIHDVIQAAFGWDNDHLFAFYLGGRAHGHDQLTNVQHGDMWTGENPPEPDAVTLRALELTPKQSFSYLFDFGDNWWHEVTLLSASSADNDPYPRLVASEGAVPVQYPNAEENDDEDDWAEDGALDPDAVEDDEAFKEEWEAASASLGLFPDGENSPGGLLPDGAIDDLLGAFADAVFDFNNLDRFSLPPADPSLRRLTIDLNLLAPAFEIVPPAPLYVDADLGDVLVEPLPGTPEDDVMREALATSPERFLLVPATTGEPRLDEMTAFADTVTDPDLQGRLRTAIRSMYPRARFERTIDRDEAEADRWLEVVDHRIIRETLAWLAGHGIYPVPSARPEPRPPAPLAPERPPLQFVGRDPQPTPTPLRSNRPKKRRRKWKGRHVDHIGTIVGRYGSHVRNTVRVSGGRVKPLVDRTRPAGPNRRRGQQRGVRPLPRGAALVEWARSTSS